MLFFKPLKMAVLFVNKSNSLFFPPLLQKSIVSADILNEVVALIIFRCESIPKMHIFNSRILGIQDTAIVGGQGHGN